MRYLKYQKIIIPAFILILIFSPQCNEISFYPNPCIKGQVVDINTNELIDSATVKIWNLTSTDTILYLTKNNGTFITERISDYWLQNLYIEVSKENYLTTYWSGKNSNDTYYQAIYTEDTIYIKLETSREWIDFSVIPNKLEFADSLNHLSIVIFNTGFGELEWQYSKLDNWITCELWWAYNCTYDPFHLLSGGYAMLQILVDRTSLITGSYNSSITITTNAGTAIIPIFVTVD
jgi:hypothetical protein